jgi:uracil-DNA glycosylase
MPAPASGWRPPLLPPSWRAVLGGALQEPSFEALCAFLDAEQRQHTVYPPAPEIFAAFHHTPFPDVRVVILGQDPYHGPGQAHGLSFSVPRGVPVPPSLANIFRELRDDLGVPVPHHGDLRVWAEQGVLLLNATLTVRAHAANAHRGRGWERFTERVVQVLDAQREGLVFVLWGSAAAQTAARIDRHRHLVIASAHPSPLSAHRGFLGSRPFSRINAWLRARGEAEIEWALPDAQS